MSTHRGTALVRPPGPLLAEGIVTHIARTPVDVDLARRQHSSYVEALATHGWAVREVPPADDCPDAVFIEDALVVCDDLAIVTLPGAAARRPETSGAHRAVAELGLRAATIEPPGTLDGGDVLQVGSTVYVGQGGRTNAAGIAQLASHVAPLGRRVVAVPLEKVLHLKSAVTALPDGTVLTFGDLAPTDAFERTMAVPEEPGAHVVPLGGEAVLIAASAPATASLLSDLGLAPIVVDISEFERLEGCVTCLSVLVWRT